MRMSMERMMRTLVEAHGHKCFSSCWRRAIAAAAAAVEAAVVVAAVVVASNNTLHSSFHQLLLSLLLVQPKTSRRVSAMGRGRDSQSGEGDNHGSQ